MVQKKKKLTESFNFDTLPVILGQGVDIVQRELQHLSNKSKDQELTDNESRKLISYLSLLKDIKKDYLSEMEQIKKELKSLSNEELASLLNQN